MPYTIRYGHPTGVSGVGRATAEAAKESVNFSRVMKNNEVRMQDRQLDLEEAQLSLQAQKAQREAALNAKKLALSAKESQRGHALAERKMSLRERKFDVSKQQSQEKLELKRMQEERLRQNLEWEMDQAQIEKSSELRRDVREQMNEFLDAGARRVESTSDLNPGEVPQYDALGNLWAKPRMDQETQLSQRKFQNQLRSNVLDWNGRIEQGVNRQQAQALARQTGSNLVTIKAGQEYGLIPKGAGRQAQEEVMETKREKYLENMDWHYKQQKEANDKVNQLRSSLEDINAALNTAPLKYEKESESDKKRKLIEKRNELKNNLTALENNDKVHKQNIGRNLVQYNMMSPGTTSQDIDQLRKSYGLSREDMRQLYDERGVEPPEIFKGKKDKDKDKDKDKSKDGDNLPTVQEQQVDDWINEF